MNEENAKMSSWVLILIAGVLIGMMGCGSVEVELAADASGVGGAGGAGGAGGGGAGGTSAGAGGGQDAGADTVVAEAACAGKAEYADCQSQKYLVPYLANPLSWESVYESMPDPAAIAPKSATAAPVAGKCVRGICCSGCVKNGACVPVSPVNHRVLDPGQVNDCGTGATACVDCNTATTKRACQYTIGSSVGIAVLTGGACVD